MSEILNLVVSRYFGMALAGAIFMATNAQAGPSYSLASAGPSSQTEQPTVRRQPAPRPSSEATAADRCRGAVKTGPDQAYLKKGSRNYSRAAPSRNLLVGPSTFF